MRYDELNFLMTLPLFSVLIKAIKREWEHWFMIMIMMMMIKRRLLLYKSENISWDFFLFFCKKNFLEIVY